MKNRGLWIVACVVASLLGCQSSSGSSGEGEVEASASAAMADVDLERVHYQFATCDFSSGEDLTTFEKAVNEDEQLFAGSSSSVAKTESSSSSESTSGSTTKRERIRVVQANDGSIIGWVDTNEDNTLYSKYSLDEVSKLGTDAAPDSEEIVFRIHYDVNERHLVYTDRKHRHFQAGVDEMQDVEVDVTNTMATQQHEYYKGYWEAPPHWTYVERRHETHINKTHINETHTNTTIRNESVNNRGTTGGGPGSGK